MLAAAWQNQQQCPQGTQTIYGCYTIGDNWTFVHGVASGIDADRPSLTVQYSREYTERLGHEANPNVGEYRTAEGLNGSIYWGEKSNFAAG